jgi:hypothetical protein
MKKRFAIAFAVLIAFTLATEHVSAQGRGHAGAAARAQGAPHRAAGAAPGATARTPGASHRPHAAHVAPSVHRPAFHSRARVGVYFGAPYYASPWWGYPDPSYHPYPYGPYYGQPAVPVYQEPPVYVEQTAPPAPQPQYWYYCDDSKTYFPHVQTCATPWVRVMPHAPQ